MNCEKINYYYTKSNRVSIVYSRNSHLDYPAHNHISVYTVNLILDGFLICKKRGEALKHENSDVFITTPYETHSIVSGEKGYSMITICISKEFAKQYSLDIVNREVSRLVKNLIKKKILSDKQLKKVSDAINELYRMNYHEEIIDKSIVFIKERVENHPEQEFPLQELSEEIFLSKYYFVRAFKKSVGLTPHKFQIQNRIRKAQNLLQKGEYLTKVALETGFYDQSHFIRTFKTIVGITPSEYIIACEEIKDGK